MTSKSIKIVNLFNL